MSISKKYDITVGGTKWFGNKVGQTVVLTAGRDFPGEGVALVLSGLAVNAQTVGGRQQNAWSSRVISV